MDPDAQLIQNVQEGSRDAFTQLVLKHQLTVRRLAQRLTNDAEEARDVAQEVFIIAWHELPRWRYKAKFFTWLYQTTWNVARSYQKKSKSHRMKSRSNVVNNDHPSNQQDQMIREEKGFVVRSAVDSLPERQKQAIYLRIYEQLNVSETAKIMKCKEGTVKALIFQAMKKLGTKLKKEEQHGHLT